ncbi:MAG: PglZ domain-containing protein [Bacteroidales bacterium]|nr:PglZ domain-containing protein [Bacteroidales bacterium]
MDKIRILWVDDEVDLLKPYVLFLEAKGYEVLVSNNGAESLNIVRSERLDIVFLDEQMSGLSGLETLTEIKKITPMLPVVMITKSEEEDIMEEAIGQKIADYLIKPVNPNQILLCLKRNLESKRLVSEKATQSYQQEFRQISMSLSAKLPFLEWENLYKKLTRWEVELSKAEDSGIFEILQSQKDEANTLFAKYIENNYLDFLKGNVEEGLTMSHTVLKQNFLPLLSDEKPTFLILIDNLRYDQWIALQPMIGEYFRVISDRMYMSILPSVTQFARNSLFAGLLPSEIEKKYPDLWVNEDEDDHKNQYEANLFEEFIQRHGKKQKFTFNKIFNQSFGKKMVGDIPQMMDSKLNVLIYNFVDMLSHASTDVDLVREMAGGESAYRGLILSWFEHSMLFEFIKQLSEKDVNLVITTDHGSIRVKDPVRVRAERDTSLNLRYKTGRKLDYDPDQVFLIKKPEDAYLPKLNVSSSYIFCKNADFFVYPNNYVHYANYYKNTMQHGGISMEEMLIPFIVLQNK